MHSPVKSSAAASPRAEKKTLRRRFHGIDIADDYAWLKADNWQEVIRHPEQLPENIAGYLKAENAYSEAWLAPYRNLQEKLVTEMRGRIKEDEQSVPVPHGPFAYYTRFRQGGEQPIFCRTTRASAFAADEKSRDASDETIMLDGDKEAAGKNYFRIGDVEHTPDHTQIAWSYDDKGSEFYTISVRDLGSEQDLADRVPNTGGGIVWQADGKAFYYVRLNEEHRPQFVCRHVVGTGASADEIIYEEKDSGFFVSVSGTLTGRFAIISCHDHETSENWVIDLHKGGAPRCIAKRKKGRIYGIADGMDEFFILTNADGAEDFKIMRAPADASDDTSWQELIPARNGVYRLMLLVKEKHLIRLERENGLPRIVVRERATGVEYVIAFDEEAYTLGLRTGMEYETQDLRFAYASPTTPGEVWDYDMESRERVLRKREVVPSGHNSEDYTTRRFFARSHDGAEVPITLLMRKGTKLDGSAPLYLYGYGSYGHAIGADFRTNPLSLVDRGVIYAIAHVRGGAEKGRHWYLDGKREKKPNTFHDFIAAAEHLIAQKYTSKGKIVAHGGSAGGMLMGAIANMRPDLFAGIVAEVPFVDVLNTMLDNTLPLTPPEWPEWGNPIESADAFNVIRGYSPYDQVTSQNYPAIFALGGLTDPRVTYWEPAKWVAKLRDYNTSQNPLLLKINMSAGHGGSSGRFKHLEEIAEVYAFVLAMSGKT
ncbi:MAG: S9 family peptidase [Pseudomonadota bacterium]